ncbi:HesA/MoeB/ThiF family protein [Carboxydothermus pertinax]|uniref:THIF-type NAD/FAD binding fold domain-containing protein n=1 Tax=Carboxydothermus pertinax TaxID=870242 RepID=A0A1L8CUN4_9THEO|nr:ThiF family adenylyltransferase [Carboxydothermus pertinax]GAV22623.1 hypothetical protein cpu_11330 [Carboxydothermus pertinax]
MLTKGEKNLLGNIFRREKIKELSLEETYRLAQETGLSIRSIEYFALENGIVPQKYVRNIGSFTVAGQKKLLASKVMVVGLGGLGGYVLEELCRAGVGEIVGVDGDGFDETNLNRQLLATEKNIGQKKANKARKRAAEINQAVVFSGFVSKVEELPETAWQGIELIFDCLDNVESRLYLEEKAKKLGVPLVHGAIGGWYGQVGVVFPGSNLLAKIYRERKKGIEQALGNPPFTPAVAASLMVALGIKLLLGTLEKESVVYFFDLKNIEFFDISL